MKKIITTNEDMATPLNTPGMGNVIGPEPNLSQEEEEEEEKEDYKKDKKKKMRTVKTFEEYIFESKNKINEGKKIESWTKPIDNKITIFDFIDYDYPDEPQFYITGAEGQPNKIKTILQKQLKTTTEFEVKSGSLEQVMILQTDKKGTIINYMGDTEDKDGYDQFSFLTGSDD